MNFRDSKAKLEPPAPVYFHCSLSDYTPETPSLKNVCFIVLDIKYANILDLIEPTSNDPSHRL